MLKRLFCLMGPTASGKTAIACELVQQFPFEIISVDSAMIYRGMDIGTAKPDADTLKHAPHHLIDILDPPSSYSAALFCADVARLSQSIISGGKIPLLVGGTMMYFRALQQGLSLLPSKDETLRAELVALATTHGSAYMHQKLAEVDAPTAARLHPNDTQRIQRALEVYSLTKKPLSTWLQTAEDRSGYQFYNFILMPEVREWLHQRIEARFEEMLTLGLIEEVEGLIKKWPLTADIPSMRTVGYRQVLSFLQGDYDFETMKNKGIAATRQLAKRQLTWLRHWPEGNFFKAENLSTTREIMAIMQELLDDVRK